MDKYPWSNLGINQSAKVVCILEKNDFEKFSQIFRKQFNELAFCKHLMIFWHGKRQTQCEGNAE